MPGNGGDYASCRKRFLPFRESKSLGKKFMIRVLATLGLGSAEERTTDSEQVLQQAARRIPF